MRYSGLDLKLEDNFDSKQDPKEDQVLNVKTIMT